MPSYGTARVSDGIVVGAASGPVLDADVSRYRAIFTNDHATQVIYLQLATDDETAPVAVVGEGIRLGPNQPPFVLEDYQGPVAAIATGAGTNLCIVEI